MIISDTQVEFNLPDLNATTTLGNAIAAAMKRGLCIYLNGDLGVGKTTLVRAILKSLGEQGSIKSPTYALVETYNFTDFELYHFDLYRLEDPHELEYLGIRDYATPDAVCLFEWAEKGGELIPRADLVINMYLNSDTRYAVLLANTSLGKEILQKVK